MSTPWSPAAVKCREGYIAALSRRLEGQLIGETIMVPNSTGKDAPVILPTAKFAEAYAAGWLAGEEYRR